MNFDHCLCIVFFVAMYTDINFILRWGYFVHGVDFHWGNIPQGKNLGGGGG